MADIGPCPLPPARELLLLILLLRLALALALALALVLVLALCAAPCALRAGSPGTASNPAKRRALWLLDALRAARRLSWRCPCTVASWRSQSTASFSILRW